VQLLYIADVHYLKEAMISFEIYRLCSYIHLYTALISTTSLLAVLAVLVSFMVSNSKIFRSGVVSHTSKPNLEGQGLHFIWLLPFDLSGASYTTRSLCSHQHTSTGHWGAEASFPGQGGSPGRGSYLLA
jgi:hypothetical protein